MPLDFEGHIDEDFETHDGVRIVQAVTRVDGKAVRGPEVTSTRRVNVQPASDKEIQALAIGGERIVDVRVVRINDGGDYSLTPPDHWEFKGLRGRPDLPGRYKTVRLDNRPWRNYCKAIVTLVDA